MGKRVMWLYPWDPLLVSHTPAKFGSYRYCGSGDITFSVCQVISKGHATKTYCNIMERRPIQLSLVAIGSVSGDKMNLAYHVISQDHVTKE